MFPEPSDPHSDARAIIDYVERQPVILPEHPNLAIAHTGVIDLRPFLDTPTRQQAYRKATTEEAFVDLVERLKQDSTIVFADTDDKRYVAVIDFGTHASPTRDEHQVFYTPKKDREWVAWANVHGKPLAQVAFAEFIEEHEATLAFPSGADLKELVLNISGTKNVTFQSGHRLQDGRQQLQYVEDQTVQGRTKGNGEIEIPEKLTIRTPIFEGQPETTFDAWLRYSIDGGKLTFTIKIVGQDRIVPDAFDGLTKVLSGLLSVPVVAGWPTVG